MPLMVESSGFLLWRCTALGEGQGDLIQLTLYYLRGPEPTIKAPTFYCNKAGGD